MKHTAPPEGVLLLKRKGHKQHHRKKNYYFLFWFWSFLFLGVVLGGGWLGTKYYLKKTNTIRIQEEVKENMQRILDALEEYHREKGEYPPAFAIDAAGNELLSWRVLLLPYFRDEKGNPIYQELYDNFNLKESWDSPSNLMLLSKMPDVYRSPISRCNLNDRNENNLTNYLTIRNPRSVFPEDRTSVSKARITNSLENTVAVIEVADEAAIPWTKPQDFEYDPLNPATAEPRVFQNSNSLNSLVCGMCDGRVQVLPVPATTKNLFASKLSKDELRLRNPWLKYFLRDKDLLASPTGAQSNSDSDASKEVKEVKMESSAEKGDNPSVSTPSGTAQEKVYEEYVPGRPRDE